MAGTTGLEPATSAVTGQRSNQLSYVPRVNRENLLHGVDGPKLELVSPRSQPLFEREASCTLASATSLSVPETLGAIATHVQIWLNFSLPRRTPHPLQSNNPVRQPADALLCLHDAPTSPDPDCRVRLRDPYIVHAASPTGSNARAHELMKELHLSVLPKESGYLGRIGESAQKVQIDGHSLAVPSQVYYMLTRDRPINYPHWLASDDTHILIEGGPVDYFIFHPDGHVEKVTLGRDVSAGERPVVAVPGGCWKALRLHPGANYALMANALSPEWSPDRVRIGEGAAWATPENLRNLIAPNWLL
jgi:predicted cupin superfamily sugar epimerase